MDTANAPRVVRDGVRAVQSVLRILGGEIELAKEEMSENLSRAGSALVMLVVGGALAILAVAALLWAAVAGLVAAGLPVWGAALVVSGGLALIAIGLISASMRNLKARSLAPTRSLSNVQRDLTVLKEAFDG